MFECVRNPTGQVTLNAYRDVDCESEEYDAMVPYGIAHILFFVVVPAAWTASKLWWLPAATLQDPECARNDRFLGAKYRPCAFGWTFVAMATNILVTATPSMVQSDGLLQALVLMGLLLLYCVAVLTHRPLPLAVQNWSEVLVYAMTWLQVAIAVALGARASPAAWCGAAGGGAAAAAAATARWCFVFRW